MEMRYFSSVQDLAFLRPGRPGIYIGCKRKPKDRATGVSPGFVWDTNIVVAVTVAECNKNLRDYNDAVRDGVLVKKTEADYAASLVAQEENQRLVAANAAAAKAKAKAAKETTITEEG